MNINPSPNIKALSIESGMVAIETDISENQDIIDAIYLFAHVSLAQIEKKHPQNVNIQIIQVD
jgi:hypothetical protein